MPPALLICSTVNWATCPLALPPGAMAPVISVAMPILIGSAAKAPLAASIHPPPPASHPAAPSALAPIRRRRPRRRDEAYARSGLSVISKPPLRNESLRTELHDHQRD